MKGEARKGERVLRGRATEWVCVALIMVAAAPGGVFSARAQESPAARTAHLQALGLAEEARLLEAEVAAVLQRTAPVPAARRAAMADFFAFVLAVSGVTAAHLQQLQGEGFDVGHALTADARPLEEQALLADLVIVGEVVAIDEAGEEGTQLTVQVDEVLKGEAPAERIGVLQGRSLQATVGKRYLLLLSGGLYRFRAARAEAPASESGYVIYRSYAMDGSRVAGSTRRQTRRAFAAVRDLDQLLRASRQRSE